MWQVKKMCLNCSFYKLEDIYSGLCRVDKEKKPAYPMKLHKDVCDKWVDAGQQYYIRKGWVKNKEKEKEKVTIQQHPIYP